MKKQLAACLVGRFNISYMKMFSILAAVCAWSAAVSAADIAFYPFTDGENGADAVSVPLLNEVDGDLCPGSATIVVGEGASASFMDDIPGRYLYTNSTWRADCVYRTDLYRSLKTTWVTNEPQKIVSGVRTVFPGLGNELNRLDGWTVEFFFKFDELLMADGLQNISFGDNENITVCLENKYANGTNKTVRVFYGGDYSKNVMLDISGDGASGKAILPGIWHHLAVSYTASTKTIAVILDYNHSGSVPVVSQTPNPGTGDFVLGHNNGNFAARFAAFRVTDRVLAASELMRASAMPPTLPETRFHWSFEKESPGQPLGTVVNAASWRSAVEGDGTNQYTYAVDGAPAFAPTGDGVVTPLTWSYPDASIGTLTMDCYASNVTHRKQSAVKFADGKMRANTVCAFVQAGPKNAPGDIFGKGPSFVMSDAKALSSSDFTVEAYWRPDVDGWRVVLGNDAGGRYRTSVFGVKGAFVSDVPGWIDTSYAWSLAFNMDRFDFNLYCVVDKADGSGFAKCEYWNIMRSEYADRCNDGAMHHYAVVYRESDGGKPKIRIYIDHVEAKVLELDGPLVDCPSLMRDVAFSLGGENLNNHPMQGWFDEVRYTARALDPEDFLVYAKYGRFSIVVR